MFAKRRGFFPKWFFLPKVDVFFFKKNVFQCFFSEASFFFKGCHFKGFFFQMVCKFKVQIFFLEKYFFFKISFSKERSVFLFQEKVVVFCQWCFF